MSEVKACYFCGDENVINNPRHYTPVCKKHEEFGLLFLREIFMERKHLAKPTAHYCAICAEKLSAAEVESINPFSDFSVTCLKHRHIARFYQVSVFIEWFKHGELPATLWAVNNKLGIDQNPEL